MYLKLNHFKPKVRKINPSEWTVSRALLVVNKLQFNGVGKRINPDSVVTTALFQSFSSDQIGRDCVHGIVVRDFDCASLAVNVTETMIFITTHNSTVQLHRLWLSVFLRLHRMHCIDVTYCYRCYTQHGLSVCWCWVYRCTVQERLTGLSWPGAGLGGRVWQIHHVGPRNYTHQHHLAIMTDWPMWQ